MRFVFIVLSCLFSASAFAGTLDSFVCKTSGLIEGKRLQLSFKVENIDDENNIALVEGRDGNVVSVTPGTEVNQLRGAINDEPSISLRKLSNGKRVLRIYGNSIDITGGELVLYADADYKRGYVKLIDFGGYTETGSEYSTVSCARKSK